MTNKKDVNDFDFTDSNDFDFGDEPENTNTHEFMKKKYYRITTPEGIILNYQIVYSSIYELCKRYDAHIVNTRIAKSIVKGSMLRKSDHIAEVIKGRNIYIGTIENIYNNLIKEVLTLNQIKDDNSMVCLFSGCPYNHSFLVTPDELLKNMEDIWDMKITEATKEEFYQYLALTQQETD